MEPSVSNSAPWSFPAAGRWRSLVLAAVRQRADAVFTVGASLAVFFMTAVQGVLLAHILGPEARGEYSAVAFYTQVLTYIGLLGALLAIARRAAQGVENYHELSRSSMRLGAATGVATVGAAMLLLFVGLPAEKRFLAPLGIVCALMLPCEHIRLALLAVDQGRGEFRRFNTLRLLAACMFPAALITAWLAGLDSLTPIVGLTVVASAASLTLTLLLGERFSWRGRVSPPPRMLLKEGLPYAAALAVGDVFNRLDMLLILWLAQLKTQGFYAAAVPAANLLIVAPNALSIFSFNAGAKQTDRPDLRAMLRVGGGIAALQACSAFAFALVLEPLMLLVYGERFHGAVPLALALLPAYAINGCSQVAEGYLRGRGKPAAGVWARGAGAVAMALAVAVLHARWRALSVPMAASVGQAVAGGWILWAVWTDVRQARAETNAGTQPAEAPA